MSALGGERTLVSRAGNLFARVDALNDDYVPWKTHVTPGAPPDEVYLKDPRSRSELLLVLQFQLCAADILVDELARGPFSFVKLIRLKAANPGPFNSLGRREGETAKKHLAITLALVALQAFDALRIGYVTVLRDTLTARSESDAYQ